MKRTGQSNAICIFEVRGKKLFVEKFPAKSLADFFHVRVAFDGHFDVFPKAINLFFSVYTMELLSNNLHCS